MMQLVVRITLLLLLPIITLASSMSFAQESGKLMPVAGNATDNIDLAYYGKWGWHKVHKKPLRRFQIESPLTPSRKIDVCFRCHKKNEYRTCDPHTQLNEKGDIIREKCLYCHMEKPDEKVATFTATHQKEVKFNRDPGMLCLGCHNRKYYIAHPVNTKHLIKPSAEMLSMMERTEKQFSVVLPLDYNGEIMCATCHNPHEKGVIPAQRKAAGGAGEKDRIRLPGPAKDAKEAKEQYMTRLTSYANKICFACHKDKEKIER